MRILKRTATTQTPKVEIISAERMVQLATEGGPNSDAAEAVRLASRMRFPVFYQTPDGLIVRDRGC